MTTTGRMEPALITTTDELRTAWSAFRERLGFADVADTLGLTPHEATQHTLTLAMDLQPSIAQVSGMYSAAALFGASDIAATFQAMDAVAADGQFPLAVQSNINLLGNSKAPTAHATARIVRAGGSVVVSEVTVADSENKTLTTATFTYVLKERKLGL